MSGGGGGTSPKHDLDDTKFDAKSEGRQYSDTPPLYDPAETHTATASLSRSFTIPTPESSPSSCTSDVFHAGAGAGGYQTVSASAPPLSSIEGKSLIFKDRYFIPKQNFETGRISGLRNPSYALPTPEVSPLEPAPRVSLPDYVYPPPLMAHDRFSFEPPCSLPAGNSIRNL